MIWTDESDARILKMREDGRSATEIFKALVADGHDVTRNAILGRTHRLIKMAKKYGRPPVVKAARQKAEPAPATTDYGRKAREIALALAREAKQKAIQERAAADLKAKRDRELADCRPLFLGDKWPARASWCRFPIFSGEIDPDEPVFCGAATPEGGPYCEKHALRCFRPSMKPKEPHYERGRKSVYRTR